MNFKIRISYYSNCIFLLLAFFCISATSKAGSHILSEGAAGLKNNSGTSTDLKLPVLPLPKYVKEETGHNALNLSKYPEWKGLESAAENRLLWHWQKLTESRFAVKESKTKDIFQIGILGKDKKFDALVNQAAPQWINKIGEQGYILLINNKHKIIAAKTETGLFYGLQTLKQLVRAEWNSSILIADWPTFEHRQIYDDISRGPISTVDYIKKQIERMAEIKINYLSFYIEHVVQPYSHPDFAPTDGKLTIPQIKELSAYAAKYYMQLVGSFQSFGHFEKILALPQYASLGATSTLISPTNPKAKKFLEDVIGELCDAFNAPYFNVDCDETFDLGQGTTKAAVDSMGASAFFASHIKFLHDIIKRHGKQLMMTGDFPIDHEDVFDMLPNDIIYLTWEYGDQPSYEHWIQPFASRHLPYMVCPGILNTYRLFPDMVMAKSNIEGFAQEGAKRGAEGVVTMIWDDGGAYLFSGDWYGVYVAAENSWTTDTSSRSSFDRRYEINSYGTKNGNYVKALFTLMKLRDIPLTYDLTFRLWQQKLIPAKEKELIINNESATEALKIIEEARKYISAAQPKSNKSDIHTLSFGIEQYRLIIDSRLRIVEIANDYKKILSSTAAPKQSISILNKDVDILSDLINRYELLKNKFKQAWLDENQPYWLNKVLQPYDQKREALGELRANLKTVQKNIQSGISIPSALAIRLGIQESSSFYFQGWMLTGPFPVGAENTFPSFLYSDTKEYDKPPSPGDFTKYQEKLYRWRKYASQDGGIIDLQEYFPGADPAIVYAYCYIKSDTAIGVQAFANSNKEMEIFCNGKNVYPGTKEGNSPGSIETYLPLKKGINNILLKLKKDAGKDWTFTFHLEDQIQVTGHKHKYQLNPKIKTYDAE